MDTLGFQAQYKGISLEYEPDIDNAGSFISILGDENRYMQILLNFVSNSLKFTPSGGMVKLEVKLINC